MKNSRSLLSCKRVKIGVNLILTLVAGTALSVPLSGQDARVRTFNDAIHAKEGGNYQEALKLFDSLLKTDPDNAFLKAEIEELNGLIAEQPSAAVATASTAEPATEAVTPVAVAEAEVEAPAVVAEPDPIDLALEAKKKEDAVNEAKARALLATAREQYKQGNYHEAQATAENARSVVPQNKRTEGLIKDIHSVVKNTTLDLAIENAEKGNTLAANTELEKYASAYGEDSSYNRVARTISKIANSPEYRDIDRVSPGFKENREKVNALLTDAQAQYIAGDLGGAKDTFRRVQMLDPNNAVAKWYIGKIAETTTTTQNRDSARKEMLKSISDGWLKPGVFEELVETSQQAETGEGARDKIKAKLNSIVIPQVSFAQGVKLSEIVETLGELSIEYDNSEEGTEKGVNIIFIRPQDGSDPVVPISLRRLSLGRILDYVAEIAQFEVEVREDAVAIIKGMEGGTGGPTLSTEIFQIDSATKLRMTGVGGGSDTSTRSSNPFEVSSGGGSGDSDDDDSAKIKSFLQRAGIEFGAVPGANLVYDGAAVIVTNTPRNVERVGQLLRRYEQANMVEIETKFLEVNVSDLDELGFDWTVNRFPRTDSTGKTVYDETYRASPRSIDTAFSSTPTSSGLLMDGNIIDQILPPNIPGSMDFGAGALPLASISSVMGQFDANVLIRAINRKSGTDLMSAPKVTVISGKEAEIVVAQELIYPGDYDRPEVSVGQGSSTGGGSAGVVISPGRPQDFTKRNVGVTLKVRPRVEQGNRIAMTLNPEIVEFEGFVEYGGRNIAMSAGQQVIAPSGYFQPIFSVRKIDTEVTIWDGATLVMGGLMREDVVRVKDKVPVLGDIPLIGALFRSEGESSSKKNLLIFVTGNLISYGGSPSRQSLPGLERSTPFSNPVLMTPGGDIYRSGN